VYDPARQRKGPNPGMRFDLFSEPSLLRAGAAAAPAETAVEWNGSRADRAAGQAPPAGLTVLQPALAHGQFFRLYDGMRPA
jgi:hypothetical protein